MAQQTRLSNWALAEKGCDTIVAGGAVEANGYGTVVNVLAAVISSPAVHANAGMAANGVEARAPVMAGVGLHETLVDIFSAVLPCPFGWTLAVVGIDSIHTNSSIHALVPWTVIHIILAVVSLKTWQASALVGMVAGLSTGASIEALRRGAGQRGHLTCAPAVSRLALATEGAVGVDAEAAIEAHAGLAALVDVVATVLPLVARWAGTVVVVIPVDTPGPVGTGTCGTGVDERAVLASEASLAHTGVLWDTVDHLALASCSIQAWGSMTGIQVLTERADESRTTYASRG